MPLVLIGILLTKINCIFFSFYSNLFRPKIQEGSLTQKAVYSNVEHGENPIWHNLPELRFKASLKEMLHESIVLHITNHGKLYNQTLGRCNVRKLKNYKKNN